MTPLMILSGNPAARLASVCSAMPEHSVDREDTTQALWMLFPDEDRSFIAQMVERSGVEHRHLALAVEDTLRPRDFTQRNACYHDIAASLALRAAQGALERANLPPSAIDVVIDVSCTGISIPALDVELSPRLGLRSDVRRIPITESGCAAGALALGLAGSFAQCGQTTLIVAVELCSLTFCREDGSRTNLVSCVLFGDGAAAAVIVPDPRARVRASDTLSADGRIGSGSAGSAAGPRLSVVGSHLFEGTREMMGFDVGAHGLRIVLQRELPVMLTHHLREAVDNFLARHDRDVSDIGLHLVHPGGKRILDSYTEIFGLEERALHHSREALRRYGNLSSVSILLVLELALLAGARPAGELEAMVLGIGPGLSMELSLWSWDA